MKKLSSYVLFVSILIFLFYCPFAVDKLTTNPTLFGQFFFLLYGVLIVLFFLAVSNCFRREGPRRFAPSYVDIILIALFLFCAIRTLAAYGGVTNLPLTFLQIPGLLIAYFIFKLLPRQWLPHALVAIICSGGIEALYGTAQLYNLLPSYNGIYKITGTFYNPGPFAGFLSIVFPVALNTYLYRKQISGGKRMESAISLFSIFSIIAILAILPSSRSRAAIIATVVSVTASFLFYYSSKPAFKENLKKSRYLIYPAMLILLVLLMGFLYKTKERSADGRLLIWKSSVPMIFDSPVFGWGFEKFSANYMNYQASYFSSKAGDAAEVELSENVYYPYNEFIRITVEYGLFGSLLVCLLLIFVFRSRGVTAEQNVWLLLARTGILAFVIFSLFSYSLEIIPILIVVAFFLSLVSRFTKTTRFPESGDLLFVRRKGVAMGGLLILLPVLTFCWIEVYRLNKGYRLWNLANLYYQSKAYKTSVGLFTEAGNYIQNDGLFLSNYGKALAMDSNCTASVPLLFKSLEYITDSRTLMAIGDDYTSMGSYDKGEIFYRKAALMVPSQLYPKYCLAKLLLKTARIQEAKNVAREILTMNVKVPSPATAQIKLEMSNLLK